MQCVYNTDCSRSSLRMTIKSPPSGRLNAVRERHNANRSNTFKFCMTAEWTVHIQMAKEACSSIWKNTCFSIFRFFFFFN